MRSLAIFLMLMFTINTSAQNPTSVFRFIEGVDYTVLDQPVRTITGDKIEVTEAFSYLCGHCFNFETLLQNWKNSLADDTELVQLHVIFQDSFKHYARIFYTAKALGVAENVNLETFRSIHLQKKRLKSVSKVQELFKSQGIAPEKFREKFNSFGVDKEVRLSASRTKAMRIAGTPQMIVDGRYSVTAPAPRDGGHKKMLEVVDYLLNKIRTERNR